MTAVLRIAFDAGHHALPVLEPATDLGVQSLGDIHAPALYPLRSIQAPRRILPLSAIAAGATPHRPVGFKHNRLYSVLLGQVQGGGQPGDRKSTRLNSSH